MQPSATEVAQEGMEGAVGTTEEMLREGEMERDNGDDVKEQGPETGSGYRLRELEQQQRKRGGELWGYVRLMKSR